VLGTEFVKEGTGEHGEALGTTNLYVDEEVAASGPMRTQQAQFTLCGDGLCVGRDSADSVSKEYASPARFKGGTILQVEINVGGDHYVDLERHAAAMMARE
jgi:arylsulfatase